MTYGDYGAVTKTTGTVDTPFKYAGRLGVITDGDGLVYLKTRYYNPQLMRFMNRDTVAGSVTDSQSLNRFSYVEGNPLTYVDLNGQARTWLTDNVGFLGGLGWDALEFVPILGNVMSAVDLVGDIASGANVLTIGMDLAGIFGGGELKGIGRVAEFASRFKPATFNRVGELAFDGISSDYKFARNADDPLKNRISAFARQDKNAGSSVGASGASNSVGKKKPYSGPKRRPKYGKNQVQEVWDNAKDSEGRVFDPHTHEELFWDKSRSRAGQWDMGHIKDHEYRKLHADYMSGKISKRDFLKEYRNPANYVPENIHANRSHKYEAD